MFSKYRIRQLKKIRNERENISKTLKHKNSIKIEEKDKILGMLKNSSLLLNAFNRILTNEKVLDENISDFTALIFANLMKCKKEKVISKNIDCIKKILKSPQFFKVEAVCFDYFKSLFHIDRFPKRLVRLFVSKFKVQLENDCDFKKKFYDKF